MVGTFVWGAGGGVVFVLATKKADPSVCTHVLMLWRSLACWVICLKHVSNTVSNRACAWECVGVCYI
jgi:hypothetical protein